MMPNTTAVLESTCGEAAVLKKVQIESKISGLLAEVSVEQQYCNQQDTNIEAVYTFPLPFDAVLLGFGIEIGGGLGAFKGKVWRIGLMGYASRNANVLLLLTALEQILAEQGHRFDKGASIAAANEVYAT